MSLASRISDLAEAIRDKLNLMTPRLVPETGTTGHVLTKTADGFEWATSSSSASQQVYVQQTRPVAAGPWVWWQTDGSGNVLNCTINDGA